jgi:hypothetical protein
MFFDHVRQGVEEEREYQVYYTVFIKWGELNHNPVFGPSPAICTGIRLSGVGIFV